MKSIFSTLALLLLIPTMVLLAQTPKPAPEITALNDWVGDWTFTGTAKDGPKAKENSLNWHLMRARTHPQPVPCIRSKTTTLLSAIATLFLLSEKP